MIFPIDIQSPILGFLDIGTSKIACLMLGRSGTGDGYQVIGFGHQKSRGLKASVVVDADAAEDAVRATIAQAEHMSGAPLASTMLAAACGRLTSTHAAVSLDLDGPSRAGGAVSAPDIDRLLEAGRTHAERDDRAALNINSLTTYVDGQAVQGSAVGLRGHRLSLDVHSIAADRGPLRHLLHLAERCQLRVQALAPAPLASALAVTTATERHLGITIVEFGAGSTGLSLFVGGNLVCAHVFPIGSNHLTFDLMRALGTTITEAERIKKNYAIQILAHPAQDDHVVYQPRGDNHAETTPDHAGAVPTKQVTRAAISSILTSRIDALLRQVLQRIDQLAIPHHLCGDVVLTGGGSVLTGLLPLAETIMGRRVRLGAPLAHTGLPQTLLHPAFATVAGLVLVAQDRRLGLRLDTHRPIQSSLASELSLRQSF